MPEILIILGIGVFWLVPILAGVWALVTLYRVRTVQEDMRERLVKIERSLQRASS